ncbi:MAG: glycosyltransferase [Candidatus Marinimicrobia bacterium]|nr:glycosyltransferase [Candidatus Neomarinimicrobiota bacterium]
MKLSIIIVNYNVKAFLQQALESIYKATRNLETEIFVVDNHSVDGSIELLEAVFPQVKLIVNSENLGFAKANNLALERAAGDYVWLLNPDTLVQEDTPQKLIQVMESDAKIGMLGCKILNDDGSLQLACRRSFPTPWVAFTKLLGLASLFPKSKLFGRYNLTHLDENEAWEVEAISGSCMFLRKEALNEVGFLDESFFMYGEDLDWAFRFREKQWKVYYTPETSIVHYKGESSKVAAWDSLTHFYSAMDIFARKHFSSSSRFPLQWLLRGGILVRFLVSIVTKLGKNIMRYFLDLGGLLLLTLLAIYLKFNTLQVLDQYVYVLPVYLGIWMAVISSFGLYRAYKYSVSRSVVAVTIGFLINVTLTYFFKEYAFSRGVMLLSFLGALVWVPGWRIFASTRRTENYELGTQRTLIIGDLKSASDIHSKLMTNLGLGYTPVGIVLIDDLEGKDERVIGKLDDLLDLVQYHKIDDVIFTSDKFELKQIFEYLPALSQQGVKIKLVPGNLSFIIGKSTVENLQPVQFVDMDFKYFHTGSRFFKRLFDILIGLLFYLFIRPFQGIAIRMQKLTEKQMHFGKRDYMIYVTKNGRVTFWSNLSLLPLVIQGKLSLVGSPLELKESEHAVKRGLFSLESVRGGTQLSEEERYSLLNYYLHNHSGLLDLEIIIKSMLGK